MTNGDLAQRARQIAVDCMTKRTAALVCSVALAETRTVDAARRVLADELPDRALAAAALAVLDDLASLEGSQP